MQECYAPAMSSCARRLLTALLILLPIACIATSSAHAQSAPVPDSAMLVVYEGGVVVGRENLVWKSEGDSLRLNASASRSLADERGRRVEFSKSMTLVVDAHDFGLRQYQSNQSFDGHKAIRGLVLEDTVFTYFHELDESGEAVRVAQPPGRLFVLDSGLFCLFDVLTRSVASKQFVTRRVQMLALAADTLLMPIATLKRAPDDTLGFGGRRVPTRRYLFQDESVRFDLWSDATGRLLRLVHPESGLRVERLPDEVPATRPKRAVRPRR